MPVTAPQKKTTTTPTKYCLLVGVTEPLDPEQYPVLKVDTADFEIVIPKSDPFYVSRLLFSFFLSFFLFLVLDPVDTNSSHVETMEANNYQDRSEL